VIGGDHARAGHFPPEYTGHYFFADAVTNEIFRMELNASNEPVLVERFASGTASGPVDLQFGPDGKLYYAAFYGSTVRRIVYAGGGNRQPVAAASVFPDSGPAPLAVTLDALESFDPEGGELSYLWDLGDGEEQSGLVVQKTYPAGAYSAQLTVTDNGRVSSTVRDLRIVSGNSRPEATITEPAQGLLYDEGQTVSFRGSGIDPEEGTIPCEGFTWRVVFHHLGHSHPFLGPLQGTCSGSFVIESHGESSTYYEVHLSVTDRGMPLGEGASLRGERSVEIYPRSSPR
jgi:PKD repeat protein